MLKVLVCLTISIVLVTAYHLNSKDDEGVSLKQFQVFEKLGKGTTSVVYVVKKIGGSDDGQLYAMKSQNISQVLEQESFHLSMNPTKVLFDMLINEREMMEAVRDISGVCRLHYAFNEGNWLFYVMDLAIGGTIQSKVDADLLGAVPKELIIAEVVSSLEKMHERNIHHKDISVRNVVIDNSGHIMLIDFGESEWISEKSDKIEWRFVAGVCNQIYPKWNRTKNENNLINLLTSMTYTSDMNELKSLPIFDEVDWERVAERQCDAPFEATESHFNEEIHLNLTELLQINKDEKLDATIAKRIQNFYFVAPEHQPLRDQNISK